MNLIMYKIKSEVSFITKNNIKDKKKLGDN